MSLNDKAAEITQFITKEYERTEPLRKRIADDFVLWQPEGFTIDKNRGDYRLVTSNRPRVWADKIVSELSYADVRLSIPLISKPPRDLRKNGSMTELAAYGLLAMAEDELALRVNPSLQSTLSWHAPVRGWLVPRIWLYMEDGLLHVDIAAWDILNTYWAIDKKGLSRVAYVRYGSKSEIDDTYGISSSEDSQGRVKVIDHWDRDKETVIVPSAKNEVVDGQENILKRVPVGLFPVGSIPHVQGSSEGGSEADKQNIKHLGESCFGRIRHIAPILSEIESYYLTTVAMGTHAPIVNEFDSSKGGQPAEFDANPYSTGATINLDVGKGQKLSPLFKPTTPQEALTLYQMVLADFSIATGPDVMYGQSPGQLTAQGTAMLLRAAAASMKDCTITMERVYTWIANELIRQYKAGDFGDMNMQGVDGKHVPFAVNVKRADLVTDHRIIAQLSMDTPQDKLTLSGILSQYYRDGVISRQTYRDKTGEVPDTDVEQEIIDREKAAEAFQLAEYELLRELVESKQWGPAKRVAAIIKQKEMMAEQIAMQVNPPQGQGSPPMPMVPKGNTPRTQVPTSPPPPRGTGVT